ncbi:MULTISPECIES: inositol monophosphatase [unclassified Sphingomonas]|uniref:inositol monophosphatase family protein n=1 Tax=unclassified Sphingomonas TaxID=196159 RepID=UPI0026D2EDF3
MKLQLTELIKPAVTLAQAYAVRRDELVTREKSAGQFVSEADEAIEASIRKAIAERFGNVAIIGEEQGGSLDADASGWAIDPIDGTANFLRGLPMWGISVGLVENGISVAGVLALPESNLVIVAEQNAVLHVNGLPFVRPANPLGGRVIALGENGFESGERTDDRASKLRAQGYSVVRYRSAVFSLASAALGRLDGYVEHGCMIWDIAAASAICRNAGLKTNVMPLGDGRFSIEAIASN